MMPTNIINYSPFHYTKDETSSVLPPPPPPPPFMIPPLPFDGDRPRKRTRTSPEQLSVLEKSFSHNPSPNSRTREQLSLQLGMPERSIQIWFQNRRAKVKNQAKRTMQAHDKALYMQQHYAASAATAACQSAAVQQNKTTIDPDLYNYYYYYYFQQIQQQSTTPSTNQHLWNTTPELVLSASTSSSSNASSGSNYKKHSTISERARAHSVGPYYYHRNKTHHERHASLGPPTSSTYLTNPNIGSATISELPSSLTAGTVEQVLNLTADTLQIGSWKRVYNLNCKINLDTRTLIWSVSDDDNQTFRMDIDLGLIQSIQIKNAGLEFTLNSPQNIQFYMFSSNEWIQCHDFTQDQQASSVHRHLLEGTNINLEWMDVLLQAPELESLMNNVMSSNLLLLQDLHLPL